MGVTTVKIRTVMLMLLLSSVVVAFAAFPSSSTGSSLSSSSSLSAPRTMKRRVGVVRGGVVDDGDEEGRATTSETTTTTTTTTTNNSSSSSSTSRAVKVSGGGGVPPPPPQPTLRQLRDFYVPCLALWTSGPLLSLIDTATVGLSAAAGEGATQLGALGPGTTFIDGATYLFAFLNVATTNLYASAKAENDASKCVDVVTTAARVSIRCGVGLALFLRFCGKPLLRLYMGAEAAGTLLTPASRYVWIRALSMPTSLWYGVVQASLLGAQDSLTPLRAVAWAVAVNVAGDLLAVNRLRMGLVGAAVATVVAQWASTAAMVPPAKRTLLHDEQPRRLLGVFPDENSKVSSKSFLAFAAPVLTLILGKLAAFGFMTHVAAALPDQPAALAAHQIVLSLFFLVSPFLEVVSQTAQTFLPAFLRHPGHADDADELSARLLRVGLVVGAVASSVAAAVPRFAPFLLTNDQDVHAAVRPLALPLLLGGVLTAPVAVSEGALLARRELGFLASVYAISTVALPTVLLRIKRARPAGPEGAARVWTCFALFQLFRAACFTGKLWGGRLLLSRSTTRDHDNDHDDES